MMAKNEFNTQLHEDKMEVRSPQEVATTLLIGAR